MHDYGSGTYGYGPYGQSTPVNAITIDGIDWAQQTAGTDGDDFRNTGEEFIQIYNGSGSQITITIDAQADCIQGFEDDITFTIANGAYAIAGHFQTEVYNDSDGYALVKYSSASSVTIGIYQLRRNS